MVGILGRVLISGILNLVVKFFPQVQVYFHPGLDYFSQKEGWGKGVFRSGLLNYFPSLIGDLGALNLGGKVSLAPKAPPGKGSGGKEGILEKGVWKKGF